MIYVIYSPDGRIFQTMTGDLDSVQTACKYIGMEYVAVPERVYEDLNYVKGGAVIPRPANPATLSGATLSNVPIPAEVTVNGKTYNTNESTVEFDFTYPGTYRVTVTSFPYLNAEFEVVKP